MAKDKPKNTHGGKRAGAGRKPKDRTPKAGEPIFDSAESYLEAVVSGTIAADPVRVQAAKTLIAYQRARVRPKVKNPTPKELEKKAAKDEETAVVEDFEKRAAEIRRKHAERLKNGNS